MNLVTGLIRPSRGKVTILGLTPDQPEKLFPLVGYCAQFDSFPKGLTGYEFVNSYLRLSGRDAAACDELACGPPVPAPLRASSPRTSVQPETISPAQIRTSDATRVFM